MRTANGEIVFAVGKDFTVTIGYAYAQLPSALWLPKLALFTGCSAACFSWASKLMAWRLL